MTVFLLQTPDFPSYRTASIASAHIHTSKHSNGLTEHAEIAMKIKDQSICSHTFTPTWIHEILLEENT